MIDLVGRRSWFYLLSLAIILPGLISLLIPPALQPGIDFTGGSQLLLHLEQEVPQATLRDAFAALGHPQAIVQRTSEGDFFVRTKELRPERRNPAGEILQAAEKDQVVKALQEQFGPTTLLHFDVNSPLVATQTVQNAFVAVAAAAVAILLYITWAFRALPQPFRYGTCAAIALLHDVLVLLGSFSLLGKLFGLEVNAMFISAALTVTGYSVNDTVVVFDRIRENVRKSIERNLNLPFEVVVNDSLLETLGRSLNTTITTLLAILALLLYGGPTIRDLLLALFIGIASGAYSSIFNASLLLVSWEKGDLGKLVRRLRPQGVPAQG